MPGQAQQRPSCLALSHSRCPQAGPAPEDLWLWNKVTPCSFHLGTFAHATPAPWHSPSLFTGPLEAAPLGPYDMHSSRDSALGTYILIHLLNCLLIACLPKNTVNSRQAEVPSVLLSNLFCARHRVSTQIFTKGMILKSAVNAMNVSFLRLSIRLHYHFLEQTHCC